MKRSARIAAVWLLSLTVAGQAAAQPPSVTADLADASFSEEQSDEGESQDTATDTQEEALSEDDAGATIAEANDAPAASESEKSENKTLKSELKQMLIGLLMPAVERRVRKAIDDDAPAAESDAESEP